MHIFDSYLLLNGSVTKGGCLVFLDLWFRGFTKSLCLAAELSKKAENSGGASKSAVGERLLSAICRATILVLDCLGNRWFSVERDLNGFNET